MPSQSLDIYTKHYINKTNNIPDPIDISFKDHDLCISFVFNRPTGSELHTWIKIPAYGGEKHCDINRIYAKTLAKVLDEKFSSFKSMTDDELKNIFNDKNTKKIIIDIAQKYTKKLAKIVINREELVEDKAALRDFFDKYNFGLIKWDKFTKKVDKYLENKEKEVDR